MAKKSVQLYTDNVLDAFYVRTALDAKFYPRTFTLKETEDYMRLEGWTDV